MEKDSVNDILVEFCTDFIDWQKRAAGEKGFFVRLLDRFGCKKVFESCMGDGFNCLSLLWYGYEVTGNEIDPYFRELALANIQQQKMKLDSITAYDWREIPDEFACSHDAVLCLGNSLTYMMTRAEQELVVRNFKKIIRPGGIVVIDHRNYDYMLDEREHILKDPQNNFRYSRKFYYCGENVSCYPVEIEDKRVVLEYKHKVSGKAGRLELYPFRREEVIDVMESAGLEVVESYGDFELGKIGEVDFYQHVGIKR